MALEYLNLLIYPLIANELFDAGSRLFEILRFRGIR
jgi:hypothetical protein